MLNILTGYFTLSSFSYPVPTHFLPIHRFLLLFVQAYPPPNPFLVYSQLYITSSTALPVFFFFFFLYFYASSAILPFIALILSFLSLPLSPPLIFYLYPSLFISYLYLYPPPLCHLYPSFPFSFTFVSPFFSFSFLLFFYLYPPLFLHLSFIFCYCLYPLPFFSFYYP